MTVYNSFGKSPAAEDGAVPTPARISAAWLDEKAYERKNVLSLGLLVNGRYVNYDLIGSDVYRQFLRDFDAATAEDGLGLEGKIVTVFIRGRESGPIVGVMPVNLE